MKKILAIIICCCCLGSCIGLKSNQKEISKKRKSKSIEYTFIPDSTSSEIIILKGCITEQKSGDQIIFGNVVLYQNGKIITGTETDLEGNYEFSNLETGLYDIEVSYVGFPTHRFESFIFQNNGINLLNIKLGEGIDLSHVIVRGITVPIISPDEFSTGMIFQSYQIKKMPLSRN